MFVVNGAGDETVLTMGKCFHHQSVVFDGPPLTDTIVAVVAVNPHFSVFEPFWV